VGKGGILFCIFLIAVAAYAINSALHWPFKAALFPLSVSIPLLILAGVQFFQVMSGKAERDPGAAVDLDFSSDVPPEIERRRVLTTFGWIVGFIATVYLLGFPVSVPLFMLIYLRYQSDLGWLQAIVTAAITWAFFYGLFQWMVHIQFDPGAIQAWLGLDF
jgi:hypothetical protein